jgi:UDP-N-acetylglucosamine diphosphorylase / glucose-1-phosphate thymidylyltransferase / UDP-N-acetylgalactosamine diphosphorylase / glucosamine-1-phosphate N-acetyltransferase / galactosamine-1-phosphate N-acetyltransferase
MTTLALCMAGLYRRFRDAGYTTPKFLLPLEAETILGQIVRELAPERLLLVANQRDLPHEAAIQAAAPGGCLRFIGDTGGQAETAAVAARLALERGWGGPIVFHNVDTILYDRDLSQIGTALKTADGFIDVFRSDSPRFSYAALDGRKVTQIAEKKVISPWATTGLYGFASPEYFIAAADRTQTRTHGEFYISDVYHQLLQEGATIHSDAQDKRTLVLGTPAEYEAYTS